MIKIVKKHIGFHYLSTKTQLYIFDSFGIEYIPQEVLNKIKDKSITPNIIRTQVNESFMCEFYCIGFIEDMLERFVLILVSRVTGCVSIFAFALLFCVPVGITNSEVVIKICP